MCVNPPFKLVVQKTKQGVNTHSCLTKNVAKTLQFLIAIIATNAFTVSIVTFFVAPARFIYLILCLLQPKIFELLAPILVAKSEPWKFRS